MSDDVAEVIADWAARREAAGEGGPPETRRSVADGAAVELREVTGATVRALCRLRVAPAQRAFVAPNAVSFAEALFEPKAWYRGIYADDVPVGFVMLHDDRDSGEYFLWRLMIDERFQGMGFGRHALELLVEEVRTRPGAKELLTSWVPGEGSPEPFYLAFGFVPTGDLDEGEVVARLPL